MLRSKFFWKLFGSYAILVVLTSLVVSYFVGNYVERAQLDAKVESLRQQGVLLAHYAGSDFADWDGSESSYESKQVRKMATVNGIRVTFIQRDGTVLLDTDQDPAAMDNHSGRPEIQEALVKGMGRSKRFSRTLGEDAMYVAYVNDHASKSYGVVRVSLRAKDNIASPIQILARTAPGASLAALLALLLGWWGARRMTAPLAEMTSAARAFQDGNYGQRIANLPEDELGDLGRALNSMGMEVRSRIDGLSEERGRLSAMLAGMAEGVLAVNQEDRISFTNKAAIELFGVTESAAKGRKLWEVVSMPGLVELIGEARSTDHVVHQALVFAKAPQVGGPPASGELRLVAKAHQFQMDGSIGAVVVFEDITELRQLERVRQDFVANVSHELKTPLTSIRGYVETLLEGAINDPEINVRFLEKIRKNELRLTALVSDLLSLARIENQGGRLVRTQVDCGQMIEEVCQRFEVQVQKAGLTLTPHLPEQPCLIWGDDNSLDQVLTNLLSNAVKYTPEGGQVTVHLERMADGMAHIKVQDSGLGIPIADQDRIFERFYRVDKARSNELGGTGLGLSIVKHQVQAMRGRVGLESVEGQGSCFHVYLECAAGA